MGKREAEITPVKDIDEFETTRFPTISDIIWAKTLLLKSLPLEIVEIILDYANYWLHSTSTAQQLSLVPNPVQWRGTLSDIIGKSWPSPESQGMREVLGYMLYSSPLALKSSKRVGAFQSRFRRLVGASQQLPVPPRGQHPAKMIIFEVDTRLRNDTWSDVRNGTFCHVGILRVVTEEPSTGKDPKQRRSSLPVSLRSQGNNPEAHRSHYLVLQKQCLFMPRSNAQGKYIIKWAFDDNSVEKNENSSSTERTCPTAADFVQTLETGDIVGMWAPVIRGSLIHRIEEVKMHVFWAI